MPVIINVAPPTGNAELDMAAINAAVKAANETYRLDPSAGKVTVQLSAGTYAVAGDPANASKGPIELLSGVALVGQGQGTTTLRLVDGFNERINGIVRTALETVDNVLVADLTIDGNRANNTGHQAGFISGIKDDGSGRTQSNVTLSGVEIKDCTAYGFNPHEITKDLVIEDCVASGNGLDGFVADGVVNGIYRNNVSYNNDRHGFNIQNASTDIILENNEAHSNGSAGLTIQRGDILREGETTIDWVKGVTIIGGKYYANTKEGILVKLSDDVVVDGAEVYGNLRQGIRIEGSTDTTVRNSTIYNNSQEADGTYDEINIRPRDDTAVTSQTYYSTNTQILDNEIYSDGAVNSRYGIREEKENVTQAPSGTSVAGNDISGMDRGSISVPGYVWTGTSGDDLMDGTEQGEELRGLAGNDTYIVNHSGDVVVENLGEGTADHVLSSITYTLTANVEHLTLVGAAAINGYGNELNNRIIGNAAANTLKGNAGHDTLDGGLGADILDGGDGNDTYYVDNAGDTVTEKFNGGAGGYDVIYSSVDYALPDEVEKLVLTGSTIRAWGNSGSGNNLIGNDLDNVLDGLGGEDRMEGGLGNDTYYVDDTGDLTIEAPGQGEDTVYTSVSFTLSPNVEHLSAIGVAAINLTGNELNNRLTGNAAANILKGAAGNDTLDGGAGADILEGGDGDDAYYVDNAGDVVTEKLNGGAGGYDVVYSSVDYAQPAEVEKLILIGGAIRAWGNASSGNHLVGNNLDNILDGLAGADHMEGGLGNDIYYVDDAGDLTTETLGQGEDTVYSSVNFTLSANVENIVAIGSDALSLSGNELDNRLTGNAADNVLRGAAGNDTLDGGAGADWLEGGEGDDTYYIDNPDDVIVESANGGFDTVYSSFGTVLADNVERLVLTGNALWAKGNALSGNILIGNAGANTLDGMGGADSMEGGDGNDVYYVDNAGDTITEKFNGGAGGYDVIYSSVDYAQPADVEKLILIGGAIRAWGNASSGNHLVGNNLDNILDGLSGADRMEGGLGNDIYYVDDAGDLTIEAPGQGNDTVYTSVNFTLSSNLENIVASGGAAINLTGNELNNRLTGNAAANVLNGNAGSDTLDGGAGDDTYYIDNPGDVIVESANGGFDTVYSSFGTVLADNVERLVLTGNALWAKGSALSGDILIGNAGANTLDGMGGADRMEGGFGNDTYYVDDRGDQVIEARGGGIDKVFSSVTYTLAREVEQLFGTGMGAISLIGNALNNTIIGNAGRNVLRGESGNDTINGGLGNDRLVGGAGKDVFVFDTKLSRSKNLDTITGFNVKDDKIKLDNAIFKKLGSKTGKIKEAFFEVGAADDRNDYILYDSKSGYLRYDADGSGKGAAIAFAKLAPNLKMTHHDFFVF